MGTISLDELEARLTHSAERGVRELVADVAGQTGARLVELAREELHTQLTSRSRGLELSIRAEVEVEGDLARIHLLAGGEYQGLSIRYARAHEWGATIRPVNRKYLTIPLEAALNGAGQARYASVQQMPFAEFRIVKGDDGVKRLLVVDARNDVAWYVLVTQVTLPERPYLRPALQRGLAEVPERFAAVAASRLVGEA